ncbi:hypothetical protein GJV04_13805 [Enterobacteriaceae bacterium RIT714]|nr:hypothetical protein [Enterobacteriaceae bacterium RIT714]
MKKLAILPVIYLLSGCPGGGNPVPHPRATFINGNHLCFSTNKDDVLSYYRIESNEREKFNTVGYDDNLNLSYPDDCINFKWKKGYSYAISYGLNGKNYVHEFVIDSNGKLTD